MACSLLPWQAAWLDVKINFTHQDKLVLCIGKPCLATMVLFVKPPLQHRLVHFHVQALHNRHELAGLDGDLLQPGSHLSVVAAGIALQDQQPSQLPYVLLQVTSGFSIHVCCKPCRSPLLERRSKLPSRLPSSRMYSCKSHQASAYTYDCKPS